MAEIDFARAIQPGSTYLHTWANLLNGDTGQALQIPGAADRTVQVDGTMGVGANLQMEGSLDEANPTNWFVLTDFQDIAITFTTASGGGIKIIAEAPLWIRPHVTTGDGTTDLNCRLLSSGGR